MGICALLRSLVSKSLSICISAVLSPIPLFRNHILGAHGQVEPSSCARDCQEDICGVGAEPLEVRQRVRTGNKWDSQRSHDLFTWLNLALSIWDWR